MVSRKKVVAGGVQRVEVACVENFGAKILTLQDGL